MTKKNIKDIVKKILDYINLDQVEIEEQVDGDFVRINIKTKDSSLLIGKYGENLSALSYLVYLLSIDRESNQKFTIDVDGYKQKNIEKIEFFAKNAIEKVKETRKTELLRPMSSFERKIVHNYISNIEGVTSKSVGEEPNRRVLVQLD